MNLNYTYTILDEQLKKVVENFFKEYPEAHVAYTGAVRLGEFSVRRAEHPHGLTFKISRQQCDDLINKHQCIVKEDDMIGQTEY